MAREESLIKSDVACRNLKYSDQPLVDKNGKPVLDKNGKQMMPSNKLLDGGGLYLVATQNGRKFWHYRYRVRATGKATELSLGSYPSTTLADARKRRNDRRGEIEAGADPSQKRQQKKREEKINVGNTFGMVATEWLAVRKKEWVPHYYWMTESRVRRLLLPALGTRPIADITGPELLLVLRKIDTTLMQRETRIIASRIFRFAVAEGRCNYDPAFAVKEALGKHKHQNFSSIKPALLPKFLHDLDHYHETLSESVKYHPDQIRISQAMGQLLVLTFLRSNELRCTQWSEIEWTKNELTVPAERMKRASNRNAEHGDHIVPLSRQAVELLEELRTIGKRFAPGSPYVFPAARNKKAPTHRNAVYIVFKAIGYGVGSEDKMTQHGCRHLASTMLSEEYKPDGTRRFEADHIERQLSHVQGGVRGVYDKAQYLPSRKMIMQAWADMLDDARKRYDGGNVVSINKRRAA